MYWLRNFVCGWFDEKDYFEFRAADVVLKLKEVDRAEMRENIFLSFDDGFVTWDWFSNVENSCPVG